MKRIIIAIAVLFAVVVLAGAGFLGWLAWQRFKVPVYSFAQALAPDGQLMNSFLSTGGGAGPSIRYVMTKPEYSLELIPTRYGYPLIGRTTDDQDIRAVPGNSDYVSLTGFMNPVSIFRKESAPPVDLATLRISEIYYVAKDATHNVQKTTNDPQLIAEVVRSMQAAPAVLPNTERIYHIELHSPDLPGLVYSIYVQIDNTGAVYLAPLYDIQHGAPAGPLFARWINQ